MRPLLACQFIQEHKSPPPVLFDEFMKMNMPIELRNGIIELLEIKKRSHEKESNEHFPVIRDFIADEIVRQKVYLDSAVDDRKSEWEKLNDCFRKVLG